MRTQLTFHYSRCFLSPSSFVLRKLISPCARSGMRNSWLAIPSPTFTCPILLHVHHLHIDAMVGQQVVGYVLRVVSVPAYLDWPLLDIAAMAIGNHAPCPKVP